MNDRGESTVNQSGRGSIWYFVFSKKEGFKVNKVDGKVRHPEWMTQGQVFSKVSYISVDNFTKNIKFFLTDLQLSNFFAINTFPTFGDDHRTYPIGSQMLNSFDRAGMSQK
jgi:hypothetical protein